MFLYPHLLWLLLLPLLLAVYQLSKQTDIKGPQKWLATGLRLLALSLVILALARPFQPIPETTRRVVAVVDCSTSMDAAALQQATAELKTLVEQAGRDKVRLVVFGRAAREVELSDAVLAPGGLAKLRSTQPGSAIGEALLLAATLCADDANGEVHLFSDGRETQGNMVSAAARLGRRGLGLTIHELGRVASAPALLQKVRLPSMAAVGEAITVIAVVESRSKGEVELTVTNDKGEAVVRRTVPLHPGTQEVPLQVRPEESGLQRYHVSLGESGPRLTAGLKVARTVVGVLETAPDKPAAQALRDILGRNATVKHLALDELASDGLDGFDVLVLADTPAAELPVDTQEDLRDWVAGGGGLLLTGGRNAFGPGGYSRSELAEALPLRFPQKKEVRDPSTAVAVIIDTSGSMGEQGVSLAKEVARLSLKRLKPHDKVGIVEFHGAKRWAAPMQPASNNIAIQRALGRLSAGGGTVMLPAIEEAYYGLLNVRARTKHVLVLTDGGVEEGSFKTLLRRMADDGIHVSTVLVGPRSGSTFLAQLAGWGRGQFYTAPSRFNLPEVIFKQPSSSLLNPFVEREVAVESVLTSQLTQELDLQNAPMLHGYVKTEPKETTELLLQSEIGDPILARWHYGLGRVAILTTQLGGAWAEDFLNWSATPNVMVDLVRQLHGVSSRHPLALTLDWSSAGLDLDIRALSSDPSLAAAMLRIKVADGNGKLVAQRDIMPVRAHAWQTRIEDLPAGDYSVEVKGASGGDVLASGGFVVPAANEFSRIAPDRDKLTAAAGVARDFAATVDAPATPMKTRELWPLCSTLGLLFFMLMILVRRLPVAPFAPRVTRAAAMLALLATLVALGLPRSVKAQEAEKEPALTLSQQEHIDGFLELESAEGRQMLKDYCRELVQHHGDLQALCDYLQSKEEDSQAASLLVVAAMADGDLDLARKTLDALIALPDPDLWALSEMARVHEMRGESASALVSLERALEKAEEPAVRFAMLVRQAQLLYDLGNTNGAREALKDILAHPEFNQVEGRNYCARIAGLHGDYRLVEELFAPTGEGRPLMRDRIYFGQILMHLERPAKAREQFTAALELARLGRDRRYILDQIVSSARAANELPDLMDRWLAADALLPEQLEILVGVLGGELGRARDVLDLLEREDLSARTQELIQSHAMQQRIIMLALETDQTDRARRKYCDLIERHPNDLYYHIGYARLLLLDGERAKAETFFRETIAATETLSGLMVLATGARDMTLREVALEAATKAGEMGELARVQAVLFEAELYQQYGEADKTLETLRTLETEIGEDAELIISLADAYQRYGYGVDSLRLVRNAYHRMGSEELLVRLIALMDSEGQDDKLFPFYRRLWETTQDKMTILQAQDRLLAIGAEQGNLTELAIELKKRAGEGRLSDKELTMLLEIYTHLKDAESAEEILLGLSEQPGSDQVDLYTRRMQILIECELYGRCNTVLRELIKLNPAKRDQYLRYMAIIALERKSEGDVGTILRELAARSEDGLLRDTFSASVLNMVGRHEEATRVYRRALADNPDEVETWLLWGNSLGDWEREERRQQRLGRPVSLRARAAAKRATGMFSVLLEETPDDDLFTLAVDGLLNRSASQQVLRHALCRVKERIAVEPHKMLLYRLAADLSAEIGRLTEVRLLLEQGLVVAGDGRSMILRELIALAKVAREKEDVISYGRTLLNTTQHLPPGECLELGTHLLDKGLLSEADGAFQRVIASGDITGAARDVIVRYENAGLHSKASKLLRQSLVANPFDVALLLRLGVLEEKKGRWADARKAYLRTLDLMIGRLPSLSENIAEPDDKDSHNQDETELYFELASRSLIVSAQTPESRLQLLDSLQERVQAELRTLEREDAFGKEHADNPRLLLLARLMRRVAIAFHRPEYGDTIDAELVKRYSHEQGLPQALVSERHQWGLPRKSEQLYGPNATDQEFTMAMALALNDRGKLTEILQEQATTPQYVETVLPRLAMCGHDDIAEMLLASTEKTLLTTSGRLDGEDISAVQRTASQLASVGLAINRPALVRHTLDQTFAAGRRSFYAKPNLGLENRITVSWPILNMEERKAAVDGYHLFAEKSGRSHPNKPQVWAFYRHLLCQAGRSEELTPADLSDYVTKGVGNATSDIYAWATVIRWFLDKPADKRPEALQQLLAPHSDAVRAVALTQFAMMLDDKDVSDELEEVFKQLFKPSSFSPALIQSSYFAFSGYRDNRLMKHARDVLSTGNGVGLTFALIHRNASGDGDGMVSRLQSTIEQELRGRDDIRSVLRLHFRTLRPAANFLAPARLDLLLKDRINSPDPFEMLVSFLLLRHAGRDVEALEVLNRISALTPKDARAQSVWSIMPLILIGYGWDAHAARFLADADDSPVLDMLLPLRLHDPLALRSGTTDHALESDIRRLHAAKIMKDPAMFLQAARIHSANTRHPTAYQGRNVQYRLGLAIQSTPLSPGGLRGMDEYSSGEVLQALGRDQAGQDELRRWLAAMPAAWEGRKQALRQTLAESVREHGLSPTLHDEIKAAAEQSKLNREDIEVIIAIAARAPEKLPTALADCIPLIIAARRQGAPQETRALAKACKTLGIGNLAQSLSRWSVARDIQSKGTSPWLADYLDCLPADKRQEALKALLPYMGINEIRLNACGDESVLFNALLDLGMEAEATDLVDRYLWRLQLIDGQADGNLHDSLAVALARLDRPDDYRRVLALRTVSGQFEQWESVRVDPTVGFLTKPGGYIRYPMYGSFSGSALEDLTRALPEPDEVEDINRYLDIHLELDRWLRSCGLLGREYHVARLCLLGRWCAQRDLQERAADLAAVAEQNSDGMLTGRLWVADLHRVLGRDEQAAAIEMVLLEHDVLPMSRVPAALEAVARMKGSDHADAIAYRIAFYSNDPEILPAALRHARARGLRAEATELVDRERAVNSPTLAASGLKVPVRRDMQAEKKTFYRPLEFLAMDKHPALSQVHAAGRNPKIIFVPISHDGAYNHLSSTNIDDTKAVLFNCILLAERLHREYGLQHVLLEGLGKSWADKYQADGKLDSRRNPMQIYKAWSTILNKDRWHLVPAFDELIVGPLQKLGMEYDRRINAVFANAKQRGWFKSEQTFAANQQAFDKEIAAACEGYNERLQTILEEDPGLKREYATIVNQRNTVFINNLLATGKTGVLFCGAAHFHDLVAQFRERNIDYIVAVPAGLSWPPAEHDDARIFSDMRKMGCQLKTSKLSFADGGGTVVKMPIEEPPTRPQQPNDKF